jgi:hypothetical protein
MLLKIAPIGHVLRPLEILRCKASNAPMEEGPKVRVAAEVGEVIFSHNVDSLPQRFGARAESSCRC